MGSSCLDVVYIAMNDATAAAVNETVTRNRASVANKRLFGICTGHTEIYRRREKETVKDWEWESERERKRERVT